MKLAALVETGTPDLLARHGHHLTRNQRQALQAIQDCRSGALGRGLWQCHDYQHYQHTWQQHRSCGHRACPRCQHHHASDWVSRQTAKRLPAPYFMLTFTLPAGLRPIAYAQPRCMYNLLFEVAMQALRRFANNHPDFGAEPGACAVLHTHSRRLEYHPHVHIIVPVAVIDRRRQQWRKLRWTLSLQRPTTGARVPRQNARCPAPGWVAVPRQAAQKLGRSVPARRQRCWRHQVSLALPVSRRCS